MEKKISEKSAATKYMRKIHSEEAWHISYACDLICLGRVKRFMHLQKMGRKRELNVFDIRNRTTKKQHIQESISSIILLLNGYCANSIHLNLVVVITTAGSQFCALLVANVHIEIWICVAINLRDFKAVTNNHLLFLTKSAHCDQLSINMNEYSRWKEWNNLLEYVLYGNDVFHTEIPFLHVNFFLLKNKFKE